MKFASSNIQLLFRKDLAATPVMESKSWPAVAPLSGDHREAVAAHLTPRQLEVLALLCEGLPNKLICRRLNIASGTVKVHISCILRELGVTSRLQAVVAAGNLGLVSEVAAGIPRAEAGASSASRSARFPGTGSNLDTAAV